MRRRRTPGTLSGALGLSMGLFAGLVAFIFLGSWHEIPESRAGETMPQWDELVAPVLRARNPGLGAPRETVDGAAQADRMRAEQQRFVTRPLGKVGDAAKLDEDFPAPVLALPRELFAARFDARGPSVEALLAAFRDAGFEWSQEPEDLDARSHGPTGAMVNRTSNGPHRGLDHLSLQYSVRAGEEPSFYGLRMTLPAQGRSFDDVVAWVETQTSAEWQLYADRGQVRTYRSASGLDLWVAARSIEEQTASDRSAEVPVFTVAFEPSYH